MKLNELLDLTLREILEEYGAVYNTECSYYYGVSSFDNLDELYKNYNIDEDYPEAFTVENLINDELIVSFDEDILDYTALEKIMKNLNIRKKK